MAMQAAHLVVECAELVDLGVEVARKCVQHRQSNFFLSKDDVQTGSLCGTSVVSRL